MLNKPNDPKLIQRHATYVGSFKLLKGKTAIILFYENSNVCRAQFDDLSLPHSYTHGWILNAMASFEIDQNGAANV